MLIVKSYKLYRYSLSSTNRRVLFFYFCSPPLPASHCKVDLSLNGFAEEASVVMCLGCDWVNVYDTARGLREYVR